MKGKFKLLGHLGLALFLVSALMLAFMPAAPVQAAATAVTDVWVEFPYSDNRNTINDAGGSSAGDNQYYVHFKATTALKRGRDTVTVNFPDGTSAMGGIGTAYDFEISGTMSASEVEFSTNYTTTDLVLGASWTACTVDPASGGYRAQARTPIDIAAGQDVWVKIASDNITSAPTAGTSYKVKVSTSKDTTPVLSDPFALGSGDTIVEAIDCTVAPATAGATGQYIIDFTPGTQLEASTGKVAVMFPIGTTVPSSIAASNVYFCKYGESSYTACGVNPTVYPDRRIVIATTPVQLVITGDVYIKFVSAAGITSPTTAAAAASYKCMVRTSSDQEWVVDDTGHAITAGSGTKIAVANGEIGTPGDQYSDSATMINMYSSQIWVYIADQYGNGVTPASDVTVTPSSSSGTGAFFKPGSVAADTGTFTSVTSITVNDDDPNAHIRQIVAYKDSTAGTHTLTFEASGYADATWTFTVCPGISLSDSDNNLISTYAPLSSTPASETSQSYASGAYKYGSSYINDAITAALAGDTVKLGDGIYEVKDSAGFINLSKMITFTSVNGAASTTIRPASAEINYAIGVEVTATSSNPVIIDGLTFTRLRPAVDIDCAIWTRYGEYLTVRNCTFNYIKPDQGTSVEGVIWVSPQNATITSLTISDNTFTNCCGLDSTTTGNIVIDGGGGSVAISGVTISGNTLTNCDDYAIAVGGKSTTLPFRGDITNNTITHTERAICLADYISYDATTDVTTTVLGNTITDPYRYGIHIEGDGNSGTIHIKNNTITGCAKGYSSEKGAIRIDGDPAAGTYYIQYNDISDSEENAILTTTGLTYSEGDVDCRYNYYGDASGPTYTALTGADVAKSNPNGTGDTITDRVLYYPWLFKSRADVEADNASYQTSTMKLVSGWNTLSTPVPLDTSADTVDELIPSGMTIGYYYDAGWTQITTDYTLSPCDAVYVKMSAAKYVQLKFNAKDFSTPSKDLAAGWNLCSLAYLASGGMDEKDAVASVYKTAANLPGYGQVVSPSLNANRYDMHYTAGGSWSYSSGDTSSNGKMLPGLGYWIYMQNAATLAGFEITPIAPDLD